MCNVSSICYDNMLHHDIIAITNSKIFRWTVKNNTQPVEIPAKHVSNSIRIIINVLKRTTQLNTHSYISQLFINKYFHTTA